MRKAVETLGEAVRTLDQAIQQVSSGKGVADCSHAVWESYSKTEYSILMLKLYLAVESPGRLTGRVTVPEKDPDKLVRASDELTSALKSAEDENYPAALESMRRGRDILRETLLMIRKIQA